ncbi:MAG: hypothetical protein WCX65_07050 [bacterium]
MDIDFNNNAIRLFSGVSMAAFLILSYRVIREDTASQKIPNSLILKFLKLDAVMFAALLAYGLLNGNIFAVNYIKIAFLNAAAAIVFGYAFWYFDICSPGDAKYLAITALFVPLGTYTDQFVPFFPAVIILINAYIIAFLAMFVYTVYLMARKAAAAISKGALSPDHTRDFAKRTLRKAADLKFWAGLVGMILYMATMLLALRTASDYIQKAFSFLQGHFAIIIVLILYYAGRRLQDLMRSNKVVSWGAYILFGGMISFQYFILRQDVFKTLSETIAASFFMIVFIPIAKKTIETYHEIIQYDLVENVKMGVVLTKETVEKFRAGWGIEVPACVALTDNQSQLIKDNIPNMESVETVTHITFGPFIFVGALFVILFRHTIIHYF